MYSDYCGMPQKDPSPHPLVLSSGQRRYLVLKRLMDIIVSAFSLLLLCLPFCLTALLLKIDSPHEPILFVQTRIGRRGSMFSILKFRTMRGGAPRYKASAELADPQCYSTKLGRFLRSCSIDELPQLVNVLRGDMSLIGPRPLIPQETDIHYLRAYYGVDALRPGILGWAQINGRDRLGICEKVYYDREYLRKVGFKFDAYIMLQSVKNAVWKTKD